jgi:HTH-type transcriptional regulator/antitoxin HigA
MSATVNDFSAVKDALAQLSQALESLRGTFIHGINSPEEYDRATALLHHLTDGRVLSLPEESILDGLTSALLAYETESPQFRELNAELSEERPKSPVEWLKLFMELQGLSGADLPEIGDKTVVSKVLNGHRSMSHKMAFALAKRFNVKPETFLESSANMISKETTVNYAIACLSNFGKTVPNSWTLSADDIQVGQVKHYYIHIGHKGVNNGVVCRLHSPHGKEQVSTAGRIRILGLHNPRVEAPGKPDLKVGSDS